MIASRTLTGAEAIREATDQCLAADERVVVIGEGVPDPKGIFGTTRGLRETYGPNRVWDMPVSENGMTGVCIGAALAGLRPILTHQRLDFALLSLDQVINNAAKWYYMFGGQQSVPLVIRMVIGHGWGQGAQHSQNLQALFAHIPGLKVVMPATAHDAKGLLIAAIEDPNPVIFLEHRWIHGLTGEVPEQMYRVPIGQANIARAGSDITIVSSSYLTIETLRAAEVLAEEGIAVEVVDLRTISPLDEVLIAASVKKTGRLLVVDSGWTNGGIAGEVIARIASSHFHTLRVPPTRLALPDMPAPSAPALTKAYYPTYRTIVEHVLGTLDHTVADIRKRWQAEDLAHPVPHDVPDPLFTGPF